MDEKRNVVTKFGNEITLNENRKLQVNNKYIHAATSDNTRKAYRSDIKHYLASNKLLPATTEMILLYLHEYATKLNPRTLERRLSALRQWHLTQGYQDPTNHPNVSKTIKGIKRIHGQPKKKAPALLLNEIENISTQLSQTGKLKDIRNNAILLIQFAGAFRVSELVNIQYEHITFTDDGIQIIIPHAKTDQEHHGKKIFIPYTKQPLCPVTALQDWLNKAGITNEHIFRSITKNGYIQSKALSTRAINYIIEKITQSIQTHSPQKKYTSHSLRRGFATEASRNNASLSSIMRQGRWKSINTVLEYTEDSDAIKDNPINIIFKKDI